MSLKTDYKDAVYTGNRKYQMTENEDGTVELLDATSYEQEGTQFGAKDINDTNEAVNRLNHVTLVALSAAAWAGDAAPYSQTVAVSGVTEDMEAILVSALEDGATAETQLAYSKAFARVSAGTASIGDGTVTFKVYKKPESSLTVGLKGV